MSYKIEEIEGIGPSHARKLGTAGIRTTSELLQLCRDAKGRRDVSLRTGASEAQLLKWVNHADLMRISGIGPEFSELLEASGVDTVRELKMRSAENLADKMKVVNDDRKLTRVTPSAKTVRKWVAHATRLQPVITY